MSVCASRSKLAASVLAGVDNIHIKPGSKVLYLGAASGTSVSHVSDIVGPDGAVYAVEFSHRSGGLLYDMNPINPIMYAGPDYPSLYPSTVWLTGSVLSSCTSWWSCALTIAALQCASMSSTELSTYRARPGEHGQEEAQHHPHHRGCAASPEVSDACAHGGRRLCR